MVKYYSTYYRKLLGVDSPTGHLLFSKNIKKSVFKKTIFIKKNKIVEPVKKRLRKANVTWSKKRRGQLMMKPVDIYEKKMVDRIKKKSGMTHIQVMHLVRKSRDSDFDIEHDIDWQQSNILSEQYELALNEMKRKINPLSRSIRDLMAENSMYGF